MNNHITSLYIKLKFAYFLYILNFFLMYVYFELELEFIGYYNVVFLFFTIFHENFKI